MNERELRGGPYGDDAIDNIFRDAVEGDTYRTRDGRNATFVRQSKLGKATLRFDNGSERFYDANGSYFHGAINDEDIIGKA